MLNVRGLSIAILWVLTVAVSGALAQIKGIPNQVLKLSEDSFKEAKPWVVWYFMHESYSKEGIKADLKAMAENGIAGAYFTPIKPATNPPLYDPPLPTLSEGWWDMFTYMVEQAEVYGIQIALFPNDGFATAAGPWITPDKSMQKIVSAEAYLKIDKKTKGAKIDLPKPEIIEGYYKDLSLVAIPVKKQFRSSVSEKVQVTSSYSEDISRIANPENQEHFITSEPGWIQYEFESPFPMNSLKIDWKASNYQVNRLDVYASHDGEEFFKVTKLNSPRMGWLDWDNGVTHTLPATTAKFFRFVYDPAGSEPGAEDLDVGKWKPSLKFNAISLYEEPRINQIEGKTGEIWRVSEYTKPSDVSKENILQSKKAITLDPSSINGDQITYSLPKGLWKIVRVGHTSTGHKNETAGAGKGLEADKLDKEVMAFQFEKWYGEARKRVGKELADKVLTVYHIDSWESGSQNWTPSMYQEFKKRRGYALDKYWPVLAGYVVDDVETSEAFLYDYRLTVSELLAENGFATLREKAHEYGALFTAETTAPVMTGDGLSHYFYTDKAMGEFWFRSPSHDKPTDVLDAVSGGHIYGKNTIMAEAFTQIRMQWDEHPGVLKPVQDRNYALGINNLQYHLFTHNPWMDRKPGMTLDGVGIYFQRDQTWWKQGREWVNYAIRSQQLLQHGKPVRQIAVFTGDEIPRRSLLPDRLVDVLPGLIGEKRTQRTYERLENKGNPMQKVASVSTTANMYNPEDWVDPLKGYAYDSFNPDVLLNHAQVRGNKVVFSDYIAYDLLVIPANHILNRQGKRFDYHSLKGLVELIEQGAIVLFQELPEQVRGIHNKNQEKEFRSLLGKLSSGLKETTLNGSGILGKQLGKGQVYVGAYAGESLSELGVNEDVIIDDKRNEHISWNHRRADGIDIYFVASSDSVQRNAKLSFHEVRSAAYLYHPVSDRLESLELIKNQEGRYEVELDFEGYQSYFILFSDSPQVSAPTLALASEKEIQSNWTLELKGVDHESISLKSPKFWTSQDNEEVKYHSGEGVYSTTFDAAAVESGQRVYLELDQVESMAEVTINGKDVGVIWTKPYQIDVSDFLKDGKNHLEIKVVNTWGNRFYYESNFDVKDKKIQTTASSKFLKGLLPSGLQGNIKLVYYNQTP